MRANRGDIHGMTAIARQEAAQLGSPIYLVATYSGYVRETVQPDGWTKHLRIDPDGQVWLIPRVKCPIPGASTEPQLLVGAA